VVWLGRSYGLSGRVSGRPVAHTRECCDVVSLGRSHGLSGRVSGRPVAHTRVCSDVVSLGRSYGYQEELVAGLSLTLEYAVTWLGLGVGRGLL
jgi:hypothetical protein